MPAPSVKFNRDDLGVVATTATTASEGTTATKSATTDASQRTVAEINDATNKLKAQFEQTAAAFRSQISKFRSAVEASDWDGKAKQGALASAQRFDSQLATLMASTAERIQEFHDWMLQQADAFNDSVTGDLSGMLAQFGDRYDSLSKVVTDYTSQMEQVDTTTGAQFAG